MNVVNNFQWLIIKTNPWNPQLCLTSRKEVHLTFFFCFCFFKCMQIRKDLTTKIELKLKLNVLDLWQINPNTCFVYSICSKHLKHGPYFIVSESKSPKLTYSMRPDVLLLLTLFMICPDFYSAFLLHWW